MGRYKITKSDEEVTKPKRINSADWRVLPDDRWNVRTFHAYFIEMNAEMFGVDYAPMRNWAAEQRLLKSAIERHGPEILRQACDICFAEYKPTREYPVLTAGFALSYRVNTIIPRLLSEQTRDKAMEERRAESVREGPSLAELEAWL